MHRFFPSSPAATDRSAPLACARGCLLGAADDRARHDDRERRPAIDPARARLQPGNPHLGHQRIPRHVRELPAPRRPARRSLRPQARVPRRRGRVHRRLSALRSGTRPGRLDRRPLHPGHRRRDAGVGDPRDHRHRVPAARRPGPRDERVRVRGGRGRIARTARRRRAHPGAQLALDLLRQPADRGDDHRPRPRPHPCRSARRSEGSRRLGSDRCSSPPR